MLRTAPGETDLCRERKNSSSLVALLNPVENVPVVEVPASHGKKHMLEADLNAVVIVGQ